MPDTLQTSPATLLIDLGNTRIKLGVVTPEMHQARFIAAYPHDRLDQLIDWISQTLADLPQTPTAAFGVSVASADLMQHIEATLGRLATPVDVRWIWPQQHAHGVRNGYPEPAQLGADRWAGMLGVMRRFAHEKRSVILANFGTATTIDTLSRDKCFLGGLILPGVSMMQTALSTGTARLPLANGEVSDFPTNTHAAITTGIVAAQLGAIRRQIDLCVAREGDFPKVCVSGGAWDLLESEWHRALPSIDVDQLPHVVLDGLTLYAQSAGPQPSSLAQT